MTAGDEKWISVPGYDGIYEVSSYGRVRSMDRTDCSGRKRQGILLSPRKNKKGYRQINLCRDGIRKDFRVSRLLLSAFVGACPPGMEAAHNNGKKHDDHVDNLRWDSHASNINDKHAHGTMARGKSHGMTKIDPSEIPGIRRRRTGGASLSELAKSHGVSKQRIWQLVR